MSSFSSPLFWKESSVPMFSILWGGGVEGVVV